MPPILALLIVIAFIAFLFRRDFREKPDVTGALWLPVLWLLLTGSRTISSWLAMAGIYTTGSYQNGTAADATVYGIMIAAGLYILFRRRISLLKIIRNNRLIVLFLAYCLISILWSDFPFVSFKRWIKILGHPIMALILFTEPDPEEAIVRLLKRCAYIIVPISILFIKYFPNWGRGYDEWTGAASNTGITTNKNELGCICMILGLFFFWQLLKAWRFEPGKGRRNELFLCAGFLCLIGWLLKVAESSTSTVSFIAGAATMLFLNFRFVNKRYTSTYAILGIFIITFAFAFGAFGEILHILGKDPTLTDRTLLWHSVLQVKVNPIVGTGFEDFWLGNRLQTIWSKWWWDPNQAHNGYLETYVNLGLIGLALMVALIVMVFRKGCKTLLQQFEWGQFQVAIIVAFALYNWTEAAFKATDPFWFIFYLVALDYPRPETVVIADEAFEPEAAEESEDLTYASN